MDQRRFSHLGKRNDHRKLYDKVFSNFALSITDYFNPRLTFKGSNGVIHTATFSEAGMRDHSGAWTHLVIVFDEGTEQFRCYINGALKQTIAFRDTCPKDCKEGCKGIFTPYAASRYPVYLGGNMNFLNPNFYRWAQGVIEAHPEHRVIITTHDYMSRYASPSANGKNIWENLAGQYENVVLAIGGHHTWDDIEVQQAEGVHGNTVTQLLIDPQGIDLLIEGAGIITMFYFSEGGSVVDIEHYSPKWDLYFKSGNQMRIDLKIDRGNLLVPIAMASAAVAVLAAAGAFFILRAKRKRNRAAN